MSVTNVERTRGATSAVRPVIVGSRSAIGISACTAGDSLVIAAAGHGAESYGIIEARAVSVHDLNPASPKHSQADQ